MCLICSVEMTEYTRVYGPCDGGRAKNKETEGLSITFLTKA